MKCLRTVLLLAALFPSLAWAAPASAGSPVATENLDLADAERRAADLRQGMSIEDVQALLGKPKRTTLRNNGGSASPQGTLQWTYNWNGSTAPGTLRVDFISKTPNTWHVNGWDWAKY